MKTLLYAIFYIVLTFFIVFFLFPYIKNQYHNIKCKWLVFKLKRKSNNPELKKALDIIDNALTEIIKEEEL